ncbi:hypothetical protein RDI58_001089 [Solanum bulbocastanum]|uniref:Uncharacterized protein n=1 Tax=Solanum bulbocastanum TaxID=147425 RepID=A0AAN8UBW5_SOLBU
MYFFKGNRSIIDCLHRLMLHFEFSNPILYFSLPDTTSIYCHDKKFLVLTNLVSSFARLHHLISWQNTSLNSICAYVKVSP